MSNDLEGFFHPKTVALIGATDNPLKPGAAILENLSHYRGAVFPVNPKHQTLLGRRCYPSVASVPDEIDLAIVALPAGLVEQELARLHDKGVRRAIVISSGFAEAGGPGIDLQKRLSETAKSFGIRIIGPNALGIFNTDNGFDSFFVSRHRVSRPAAGRLSIISQSGAVTVLLVQAVARHDIALAKGVNYEDGLDIDAADGVDYFADDPQTG